MFSRLRSHSSAIMFDVGAAGVRVCQLGRRAGRLTLRDHLQLELPLWDEREDPDDAGVDCARLARALGQARFSGNDVGLVLSPPTVQFHTLDAPGHLLSKSESTVREALAWEIARETRTEPGDWEVRYWTLPAGGRPGRNVMSAAVSSPLVRGWISDFARYGLQLRHITVSPCALACLARRAWTPTEQDAWGVLDVGHRRSVLTVLVESLPVYVRSIPIGAGDWTRRLAAVFDVSPDDAERIKRGYGFQRTGGGAPTETDKREHGQSEIRGVMFNTLRPALDELVREINRCFLYVLESYPNLTVAQLFLAGGGAKMTGLAEYLGLQLDLPTPRLACGAEQPQATESSSADLQDAPPENAAALGASFLDLEAPRCSL